MPPWRCSGLHHRPGRPCRPGFTPPRDWQPDESWPKAPDGRQFWQPVDCVARTSLTGRTRGAALVIIVGAILAIVGSLGPWVTAEDRVISISRSGFQDGRDGPWMLILAVLALIGAACRIPGWSLPHWLDGAIGIDGEWGGQTSCGCAPPGRCRCSSSSLAYG
jgi:hypothetical protein